MVDHEGNKEEGAERGRPTVYDPSFVEQVEKLCHLGATDTEIADFFNVDVRTIYRWKLKYPDFCQAIKIGKEPADDRVERSLYQRAAGYSYVEQQAFKVKIGPQEETVMVVDVERHQPCDTTAAIFWNKNRKPKDWKDVKSVDMSSKDGTMTPKGIDLSSLSPEVLEAVVAAMDKSTEDEDSH